LTAGLPVRVIVLGGRRRNINNTCERESPGSRRLAYSVTWSVTSDHWHTGGPTLTRGGHPEGFVDQFSLREAPQKKPRRRTTTTETFVRNPGVRTKALVRANGTCEFCEEPGFETPDGKIFLETHHIIPLEEDGPDVEIN